MTFEVVTFGCRLNAYESEAIRARASEAQLQDAVVFNTCAVTAEAVRQSRQAIRKMRRRRPHARIIVTGCAAQVEPETYAAMTEVDLVLGNQEKLKADSYAGFPAERIRVNDIMSVTETAAQMLDSHDGHTRAFLQIQNGCDHRCTFCIIPHARGNSRSVGMGEVIAEARRLTEKGFAEIVLTGVDLTSYGSDLPGKPTLGVLLRKLLGLVPGIKRLRLSSLDSIEADDALLAAIAEEERLMPHFHLSVQAGDDLILKRMKRRHARSDTIAFCDQVRRTRPDAVFGADFITGFPTETEEMFANSLRLVDDAGLSFLHVFPFSPRERTPAARMPQLGREIAKARAVRLRAKGDAALASRLRAMIGSDQEILVERGGLGRTRCFAPVRFAGVAGSFVTITVSGAEGGQLLGHPDGMKIMSEEKTSLFARLKSGLSKSAAGLTGLFTRKKLDAATIAELEEALIRSDMGVGQARAVTEAVAKNRYDAEIAPGELRAILAGEIAARLAKIEKPLVLDAAKKPFVILVAGVNGTGKTTTIGKLARRLGREGHKVLLAAGDTFRAAAIEQLGVWATRAGAGFVATKAGGDAAGLAFEALEKAQAEGRDILIIDTAGRLQNKAGLMAELEKIARVIKKLDASAPHAVLLVLDATTGQNAISQVEAFTASVPLTGLIMTKLDGTAKGGILVALAAKFALPVHFIGVGEGEDDLMPFDAAHFAKALTGAA